MVEKAMIRIGPAGWSYADWKNLVYPTNPGSGFDPLSYLASFFDTIEINSTFYRTATTIAALSWARRVAHNPGFKFTVKLHRDFTHARLAAEAEIPAIRAVLDALAESDRLGALLIQFPWSFRNNSANRPYLADLLGYFGDYPLAVELRHASWSRPSVYQSLERRAVALCNIDQPVFFNSLEPSAVTTSPLGYVRLHGRNYENWFKENIGVLERYDYLYSKEELKEWVDSIRRISGTTRETYVIANNHARGKAIVNALEIKAEITGEKVSIPDQLLFEYPRLLPLVR
jgi:uncharacterized protein YecE (DUF72 family)